MVHNTISLSKCIIPDIINDEISEKFANMIFNDIPEISEFDELDNKTVCEFIQQKKDEKTNKPALDYDPYEYIYGDDSDDDDQ